MINISHTSNVSSFVELVKQRWLNELEQQNLVNLSINQRWPE